VTHRVGSLFSGTGAMDLAVCEVLGATVAWHCETEPAANRVLAHHWPGVPNLGDVAAVDWADVEPVDVLTAGWPCQPWSQAGRRRGSEDERALWPEVAGALRVLRPRLFVGENVPTVVGAGELERALGDLSALGFDAEWAVFPASAVGAPHRRERLFLVAWPAVGHPEVCGRDDVPAAGGREEPARSTGGSGVAAADPDRIGPVRRWEPWGGWAGPADHGEPVADPEGQRWGEGWPEPAGQLRGPDAALGCNAAASDTPGCGNTHQPGGCDAERLPVGTVTGPGAGGGPGRAAEGVHELGGDAPLVAWGDYGPAVRRWELILGRPAPAPTQTGKRGGRQLAPRFVEWMQGYPAGWVTAVPGLRDRQRIKMLGNGVVPQQCAAAVRWLLDTGPNRPVQVESRDSVRS